MLSMFKKPIVTKSEAAAARDPRPALQATLAGLTNNIHPEVHNVMTRIHPWMW
jgi:hypothetical protein